MDASSPKPYRFTKHDACRYHVVKKEFIFGTFYGLITLVEFKAYLDI